MRFKVLAKDFTYKSKQYIQGDIITTDADLASIFINLFSRIEEAPADAQAIKQAPVANLPPVATPIQTLPSPQPAAQDATRATVGVPVPPVARGKDVTKNFKRAVDEDFLVYKVAGGYNVHDADAGDKPLNASPITKPEVDKFILKQVAAK